MSALAQRIEEDLQSRAANDDDINGGLRTRTKYSYVQNRTVSLTDPTGFFGTPLAMTLGYDDGGGTPRHWLEAPMPDERLEGIDRFIRHIGEAGSSVSDAGTTISWDGDGNYTVHASADAMSHTLVNRAFQCAQRFATGFGYGLGLGGSVGTSWHLASHTYHYALQARWGVTALAIGGLEGIYGGALLGLAGGFTAGIVIGGVVGLGVYAYTQGC